MLKSKFGNTSDRYTSRWFFEAVIAGISFELIYSIKVLLETVSSGHDSDVLKYDEYA